MVGAAAPRMLRLTAELADEWNAGMRTPEGAVPMGEALDGALAAAGRDPRTIRRSVEALVQPAGVPPTTLVPTRSGRGSGRSPGRRRRSPRAYPLPRARLRTTSRSSSARTASSRSRRFAPVLEALAAG